MVETRDQLTSPYDISTRSTGRGRSILISIAISASFFISGCDFPGLEKTSLSCKGSHYFKSRYSNIVDVYPAKVSILIERYHFPITMWNKTGGVASMNSFGKNSEWSDYYTGIRDDGSSILIWKEAYNLENSIIIDKVSGNTRIRSEQIGEFRLSCNRADNIVR